MFSFEPAQAPLCGGTPPAASLLARHATHAWLDQR